MLQIPILTYHSLHAQGFTYSSNDHVALEQDLTTLKSEGYRVMRLPALIDLYLEGRLEELAEEKVCAITFDDGVLHDFVDFYHPDQGLLKSFARILSEATESHLPGWEHVPATSFVIASPDARAVLDVECIAGRNQWHDHWWLEAVEAYHFDIGNHSWNHTHPVLEEMQSEPGMAGNFFCIDREERAHQQILKAEDYLCEKLGKASSRLFAYPYGHVPSYLVEEFLPKHADRFKAAIATGGRYFSQSSPRWAIPRFVCGEHWQTPEGLQQILINAGVPGNEFDVGGQSRSDSPDDVTGETGRQPANTTVPDNEPGGAVANISGIQPPSVSERQVHTSLSTNNQVAAPPFFLVGCVRSGTTLLRNLLKQHPNLHAPEETHLFRWPHPFGTVDFSHIQQHNETLRAHRGLDGVSEERYEALLNAATSRRALQDGYAKLFFESQNIAAGRWFDKTPQNIYGILLLSAVYPEAKFVHIVRHPLNVVTSLKAGKVMGPHSLEAAINTWFEAVSIAHEFGSAWPDRLHTLTYENLTQSPQAEMRALLDFLGEPALEGHFDFTQVHPERDRYQEDLTGQEQDTVRQRLASEMARYGYL